MGESTDLYKLYSSKPIRLMLDLCCNNVPHLRTKHPRWSWSCWSRSRPPLCEHLFHRPPLWVAIPSSGLALIAFVIDRTREANQKISPIYSSKFYRYIIFLVINANWSSLGQLYYPSLLSLSIHVPRQPLIEMNFLRFM